MNIVTNLKEWQNIRKELKNKTIGFVPTMGNLHNGHMSLCERSKVENEISVISIFVNPTQFNQQSDFDLYPRTLEQDTLLLQDKVDFLFLPPAQSLYEDHYQVKVIETDIGNELEGEYRPGHFSGMLTIVLKLFNLVQPSRAYFGEKDFQQLLLIQKMVKSLFLSVEIIPCKTIRAEDGLALSSRNARMNEKQREKSKYFPELLQSALTPQEIKEKLEALGFKVDYIIERWQRRLGAVWIDDIRLIDNIEIYARAEP